MGGEGINRIDCLRNLPAQIRRHDGLLVQSCSFPDEAWSPRGVAIVGEVDLAGIAGGNQGRPLIHGSVAIDAINRRRVARLAIELPISVHIYLEMAIRALHSMRQMDVLQVD